MVEGLRVRVEALRLRVEGWRCRVECLGCLSARQMQEVAVKIFAAAPDSNRLALSWY